MEGASPDRSDLAFVRDSDYVPHEAAPFIGMGGGCLAMITAHTTKRAASSNFN
jgi:hypothetical protein